MNNMNTEYNIYDDQFIEWMAEFLPFPGHARKAYDAARKNGLAPVMNEEWQKEVITEIVAYGTHCIRLGMAQARQDNLYNHDSRVKMHEQMMKIRKLLGVE